jgi:hypothetical protein
MLLLWYEFIWPFALFNYEQTGGATTKHWIFCNYFVLIMLAIEVEFIKSLHKMLASIINKDQKLLWVKLSNHVIKSFHRTRPWPAEENEDTKPTKTISRTRGDKIQLIKSEISLVKREHHMNPVLPINFWRSNHTVSWNTWGNIGQTSTHLRIMRQSGPSYQKCLNFIKNWLPKVSQLHQKLNVSVSVWLHGRRVYQKFENGIL